MEIFIISAIIFLFSLAAAATAIYFYRKHQQRKSAHKQKKEQFKAIEEEYDLLDKAHEKRLQLHAEALQCNHLIQEKTDETNIIAKEDNPNPTKNLEFSEKYKIFHDALIEFTAIDYQFDNLNTKDDVLNMAHEMNEDNAKFERIFHDMAKLLHDILYISLIKKPLVMVKIRDQNGTLFAKEKIQPEESIPLLAPTPLQEKKDININANPSPPTLSHNKK